MSGKVRIHKGPLVRKRPRARNKDGTWRKKRSDAGKKREKVSMSEDGITQDELTTIKVGILNMAQDNNPRGTQFVRFAELVYDEILDMMRLFETYPGPEDLREKELEKQILGIIARRAFDFEAHTVGHTLEYLHECGIEMSGGMKTRIVPSIPDMTELPKEQEHERS